MKLRLQFVFILCVMLVPLAVCQPSSSQIQDLAARIWADGLRPSSQVVGDMEALPVDALPALLSELDRKAGSNREGANLIIGMALQVCVQSKGPGVVSKEIIGMIEDINVDNQLQRLLLQKIELWTDMNNVRGIQNTVDRLAAVDRTTGQIPVDWGLCRLLRTAYSNARREGRQADAEAIVEMASKRVARSLPELVKHAHDDGILNEAEKGWGSMKMFAFYRGVLDEVFDRLLIDAFDKSKISVSRQLGMLERMAWIEDSKSLANYLARLKSRAEGREIVLSQGESAIIERLLKKYGSARLDGISGGATSVADRQPQAPSAATPKTQIPTAAVQMGELDARGMPRWLLALGAGLLAVVVLVVWRKFSGK